MGNVTTIEYVVDVYPCGSGGVDEEAARERRNRDEIATTTTTTTRAPSCSVRKAWNPSAKKETPVSTSEDSQHGKMQTSLTRTTSVSQWSEVKRAETSTLASSL